MAVFKNVHKCSDGGEVTSFGERRHLWAIALALLATFLAVSNQSFWIDESITAKFAMQPTFGAWLHTMLTARGSDPQMPFYLLWIWGWEKIFGHDEYALRMAGWPFLAAGIVAFSWRKPMLAIVCALSAFAWYYINEARPYSMQIGLALAMMGAAMRLAEGHLTLRSEIFWQMVLIISGVLLGLSHLLGMFWTAASWGFCILCLPSLRNRAVLKKTIWAWLGACFLLLAVCCYYLWTIKNGLRATDAGVTDIRNVCFDLYELLGFGGLGPGRLEIRDGGLAVFKPYAPWLALYGLLLAGILFVGIKGLFGRLGRKSAIILLFFILMAAAFIFGIGVVKHFRVLGRHFAPMLPIFLWMMAEGAEFFWHRRGAPGKLIVSGWITLALLSCLEYRFAERHAKDDYRSAAAVAKMALKEGQTVWWDADPNGASYYGVPLSSPSATSGRSAPEAVQISGASSALLEALPRPDFIIASKPDLFDPDGRIERYIESNHYTLEQTLVAFKIFEK